MVLGVNDSIVTSAQRTRSSGDSRASGLARSRARPSLPALTLPNCRAQSGSVLSSWKLPAVRSVSRWWTDSTRTTVAPRSARARLAKGPAKTHMKSATLRPSRGRDGRAFPARIGRPPAEATRGRRRTARPARDAVCAPRAAAAGRGGSGRGRELGEGAGEADRAGAVAGHRHSTSCQKARSARCSLWTSSSVVVTGAISTRRLKVASKSSALVLVAEEVGEDLLEPLVLGDRLPPVVEHDAVVDPVLVPGGLVAEALLVDPLHQAPGEGPMEEPNRNVTDTWPSLQGHSSWILVSSPLSRTPPATRLARPELPGWREQEGLAGHAVALLGGEVDVLAPARVVVPLVQRHQGGAGGVGGGVEEGLGHAHPQRRAVLVAGQGHGPRRGGQHQVAVGPARLGAVGAEGGDREVHERRVGRLQHVPAQAASLQLAAGRTTPRARRPRPAARSRPLGRRLGRGRPRSSACPGCRTSGTGSGRAPSTSSRKGPTRRLLLPPGGSTRITSAPSSARICPHSWPRSSVRSSTR